MSTPVLCQPTGEMWQRVKRELNENIETRDRDVAYLQDWLRKQPHLPDRWDDKRLMNFLRANKFSLEKAKRKLDMYFTVRSACPEFFTNRDVTRPEFKELLTKAQGPPLPKITPKGYRVTIARALDDNIDASHLTNAFKLIFMIGDVRMGLEEEGVVGDVYILDAARAISPSNLARVSPSLLKKFLICVQEAYAVRVKEVHVVNASPLVDTIVTMVKPFLKQKLRERIFIHTDMKTLFEYVPKDVLPPEYGGTSESLEELTKIWIKKLEDFRDWFIEQESLKANEALRPGKPTNYDELFGIDGSFRQLSID
ncbi:alpha-tocopherol transfer protein-like [Plodia interpunctella]|uniref:alpha-tocopherol transfer protein-like n=1 Tax=Plodia interpunctella TaxID=58824 RepID=UPI002367A6C9|nr:alpha-tocopherol transfer protein-like [Plodia interpunctella]